MCFAPELLMSFLSIYNNTYNYAWEWTQDTPAWSRALWHLNINLNIITFHRWKHDMHWYMIPGIFQMVGGDLLNLQAAFHPQEVDV